MASMPSVAVDFDDVKRTYDRHDYELTITVENATASPIMHVELTVQMPSRIRKDLAVHPNERKDPKQPTLALFELLPASAAPLLPLLQGRRRELLRIPYYFDRAIYDMLTDGKLLPNAVGVTLFWDGGNPIDASRPLSQLNRF